MRRTRPRTLELGSYSSGTMRSEDLIPAFLSAAEGLRLSRADRQTINRIRKASEATDEDSAYWEEDAGEDLSELFDLLDRYCPDYCSFGAHPGDGADYGVWVCEELLSATRQGSYDGDVYRVKSGGGLYLIPAEYGHALVVSDHGNATLYRRAGRRWVECWAIDHQHGKSGRGLGNGEPMTTSTFLRRAVWAGAVGLVFLYLWGLMALLMAL